MNGLNKLVQLICTLPLLWGASAFAVDGVLEINQACALNGGCFSGDNSGYPVAINQGGSYRLTSDLTVDTTSGAIWILTSDVTLDLNGFTISSSTSQGNGLNLSSATNVEIRGGTIRGFSYGVFINSSELVRVIDVRAFGNAAYGLLIQGNGSIVRGCTVAGNERGIRGFPGSLIVENVVHDNTLDGMVLNNVAYGSNVLNGNTPNLNSSGGVVVSPNQCGNGSC